MSDDIWQVVGGADKGGIIVREQCSLSSPLFAERLSCGSIVRQVELVGERLHYECLRGSGPASGWVSTHVKDKPLLVRIEKTRQDWTEDEAGEDSPCVSSAEATRDAEPPLQAHELRICTWNILAACYHRDRVTTESKSSHWKPRAEAQIHAILDAADPDVLCLQEVFQSPSLLSLFTDVAKTRGYQMVAARRGGSKFDGLAILVRIARLQIAASETQEICNMGDRIALWLHLRLQNPTGNVHSVVIGNTHFTFPHGEENDDQRLSQGYETRQGCYKFAKKQGLNLDNAIFVIAGDLNCEHGPADDDTVLAFRAENWRSAFAVSNGKEAQNTHRTHRGNHTCADLVLVRGNIDASRAVLLPVEEPDTATMPRPRVGGASYLSKESPPKVMNDWAQLSDHRPLVTTLAITSILDDDVRGA